MILSGRIVCQSGSFQITRWRLKTTYTIEIRLATPSLTIWKKSLTCTTRAASRRRMEIGESQSVAGQLVEVWRLDLATEAAQVAET